MDTDIKAESVEPPVKSSMVDVRSADRNIIIN